MLREPDIETSDLTEALHWRYAAKRMNGGRLSPGQLGAILDAIRLAPSGRGLQPYRIGMVEEKLDALLGLPGLGLRSTVLLALGFRDTGKDWLVNLKKVRRPAEELFFPAAISSPCVSHGIEV